MRSWGGWLAISAAVILLDQFAKHQVVHSFRFGEGLAVTSFFNLVLAHNTGAAFSLLANGGGWQRGFFIGVALLAAGVIVHLLRRHYAQSMFSLSLSLILGGALGNLWDRVVLGYVVDFLDFHFAGYHWPAFNVADMAITGGAALLILDSFRKPAVKQQD